MCVLCSSMLTASLASSIPLHDALPIYRRLNMADPGQPQVTQPPRQARSAGSGLVLGADGLARPRWASVHEDLRRYYDTERSEEHTSELQSRGHLVCRLLPEKKNQLSRG